MRRAGGWFSAERAVRPVVLAQAVSVTGTQITAIALPTIAVLLLDAQPLPASLLFALEYVGQGLMAPVLGVLVDTVRSRRPLLIGADLIHALVVLTVPVAYWVGGLSMGLLFAVATVSGILAGLNAIGVQSLVPQLVPADRLVAANVALTGARSVGQISGPALAGWLVQALGAAVAVVVDTASYCLSALAYLTLRVRPVPIPDRPKQGMYSSLREGFAVLRERPVLLRIAAASAALNVGGAALGGLYALYAYRTLRLTPAMLGLTMAVYSAAAVIGVSTAGRVIRGLGLDRVVPVFAPIAAAALLLIPAAVVLPPLPTLVAYEAVFGYCATVWTIGSMSLVQALVANHEIGRVMALTRTAAVLAIPVGALLAGALADAWRLVPTLVLFAIVALVGTVAVAARGATYRYAPAATGEDRSARI